MSRLTVAPKLFFPLSEPDLCRRVSRVLRALDTLFPLYRANNNDDIGTDLSESFYTTKS